MKHIMTITTCLSLIAGSAVAEGGALSSRLGEVGIQPAITELEAVSNPNPEQRFTLGGLYFLGAVERTLQLRYKHSVNPPMIMMADIPLLRLPIPENPSPEPFNPVVIETLFTDARADFAKAIDVLNTINDEDDFGAMIDTGDIWFDINSNGARDQGEGLANVLGAVGGFRRESEAIADIKVRFDTSDAAWLSAYAHLLSGISEVILSLKPTERVTAVMADVQALDGFGNSEYDLHGITDGVDAVTMIVEALETTPDAALMRSAHGHFLSMIQDNHVFWARVAAETDDNAEWIPNNNQSSALPFEFPADTGKMWQGVLAEAEAVLKGELLIWHWRFPEGVGVNLAKFMENPPKIDVLGMIQGRTLLPYIERGPIMEGAALGRFNRLVSGDAGLFMVILN